jgi:site-specific recombinase XerD
MARGHSYAHATLARRRAAGLEAIIASFLRALEETGYSPFTICDYVRAAEHIEEWLAQHEVSLEAMDESVLARFRKHLARCHCRGRGHKGVFRATIKGAKCFLAHLRRCGVAAPAPAPARAFASISDQFVSWMLRHRGAKKRTLLRYQRMLVPFLEQLGDDPQKYTVQAVRSFVISHLGKRGRSETRMVVTAIRSFLRFLVAERRVTPGLQHCVPTVPQWRLAALPRYLESTAVERVLDSCNLSTVLGRRDHAILLLLARLGLRAGDIVAMELDDIDWKRGTLRVHGKTRRDDLLPLPQDVGDAVLCYLRNGRQRCTSQRMFLAVNAPIRPFATSVSISDIVRFALQRAGITNPPSRGAHLLRHSAATAMLRAGGPLEAVATVLRHKSPDTTTHYAKIDVALLALVAQPWPGGQAC